MLQSVRRFMKRLKRHEAKATEPVTVPRFRVTPDRRSPMKKAMEWRYMRKARRAAERGGKAENDNFDRLMERFE